MCRLCIDISGEPPTPWAQSGLERASWPADSGNDSSVLNLPVHGCDSQGHLCFEYSGFCCVGTYLCGVYISEKKLGLTAYFHFLFL